MDKSTLDDLRQKEAAATKGPWHVERFEGGWDICGQPHDLYRVARVKDSNGFIENAANPDFIAAARNAMPELLELAQIGMLAVEHYKAELEHNGDKSACNPQWEALNDACNAYTVIHMTPGEIHAALLKSGYTEEELQINKDRMRAKFAAFRERMKEG